MPSKTQRRGSVAEQRAAYFLIRSGYKILDRHVTSRYGEIDLLCQARDGTIVAVEVKMRSNKKFGSIYESIPPYKIRRLIAVVFDFMQRTNIAIPIRIDAVFIDSNQIQHVVGIGEIDDSAHAKSSSSIRTSDEDRP